MHQFKRQSKTQGRMLAFLLAVALIATVSLSGNKVAYADGSGGGDTVISAPAPAYDSTEYLSSDTELREKGDSDTMSWLSFIIRVFL